MFALFRIMILQEGIPVVECLMEKGKLIGLAFVRELGSNEWRYCFCNLICQRCIGVGYPLCSLL